MDLSLLSSLTIFRLHISRDRLNLEQHPSRHIFIVVEYVMKVLWFYYRLSGIDSNIEEFPPPAACSHLSKEELLCHLVQILLWAKGSVFGRYSTHSLFSSHAKCQHNPNKRQRYMCSRLGRCLGL